MENYTVKTRGRKNAYLTVIKEIEDGYVVRIVRDMDGYNDIKTDFISKALFDSCVRTGYISKIDSPEQRMAANA